jgi:hypothetical protein
MAPPATAVAPAGPPSSSRKRKTADAADATAQQQENKQHLSISELLPPPPIQNEYELQRQQRIERNRQIMQELGVVEAAAAVKQLMNGNKRQRTAPKKKVGHQMQQSCQQTPLVTCIMLLQQQLHRSWHSLVPATGPRLNG